MYKELFNYDSIQNELAKILYDTKEEICDEMKRQGKWVTGQTGEAIEVHTTQTKGGIISGSILAPIALLTLETGRRGGKIPNNFPYILIQWAIHKRLTFKNSMERQKFAFHTARKIANEGSKQYRSGRRNDLYSSIIRHTTQRVSEMCDSFAGEFDIRNIIQNMPTTKISFTI